MLLAFMHSEFSHFIRYHNERCPGLAGASAATVTGIAITLVTAYIG